MEPSWRHALATDSGGVRLDLEVVPGASDTRFPDGYNPWRRRIRVRIVSPASEGRANEELVQLVATFFDVPLRGVRLVGGLTARLKAIRIEGLSVDQAAVRLGEVLGGR